MVIGIDPGTNGGVAYFHTDWIAVEKLPQTGNTLLQQFREYTTGIKKEEVVVYIECVRGRGGWGATQSFNFGRGVGRTLGIIEALEWEYKEVTPTTWQKRVVGTTSKGDKNMLKEAAQELYGSLGKTGGSLPITLWSADALLIATYGSIVEEGM
jgi:hypothetical protein